MNGSPVAEHTIIVRPEIHQLCSGKIESRFQIHLDRLFHLASVLELGPLPPEAETMLTNLSLAFGFGVAANLLRSEPDVGVIRLEFVGTAHKGWKTIASIFSLLSNTTLILEGNISNDAITGPNGAVFLVSGGKDSLFALSEAKKVQNIAGCHGIYLGRGSELNWRQELPQVEKYARHFDLHLHHVELAQYLISSRVGLRFVNRAVWRELITITLARLFGDHIYTGINNDALARLEWIDPHFLLFLSQFIQTLEAMQQILDACIETTPGELEVYRRIRTHPLFSTIGSCLRPDCQHAMGSCLRSECHHYHLCAKHRGFAIYEKVLSDISLDFNDIEFIHSDLYLGDAVLLAANPMPMEVLI